MAAELVKVPIAFISYSHDSKEHKAWVAALAKKLMDKGIDVLFDQWDLGPGDDVPKFMEQAVAKADRVLMVCSEPYVRKADDGKGGVGYEAMVVTGELVQDLGTNKFIPIVRQTNAPKRLPRCVSTRFYIDLSNDADFEEPFELLLHELHNIPKVPKPQLGKNPFAPTTSVVITESVVKREQHSEVPLSLGSPEAAYKQGLEIVLADNQVAWRKLSLSAVRQGEQSLRRWRIERPDIPVIANTDCAARFEHTQLGVQAYAPLLGTLLAAAEAGKEPYVSSLGWVDSILHPADYPESTTVYHLSFPQTILFVVQTLFGGMLMVRGAGAAAHQLSTTKVPSRFDARDEVPLFSATKYTGWPDALEHSCSIAWGFLDSIISSWPWLKEPFGSEQECRSGISAYYHLLSFLNFIKLYKDRKLENIDESVRFPVTVPLCFCVWPAEVVNSGYRTFLRQAPILRRVMESNGMTKPDLESAWKKWMEISGKWLGQVYLGKWPPMFTPQANLPQDLETDPFVVT